MSRLIKSYVILVFFAALIPSLAQGQMVLSPEEREEAAEYRRKERELENNIMNRLSERISDTIVDRYDVESAADEFIRKRSPKDHFIPFLYICGLAISLVLLHHSSSISNKQKMNDSQVTWGIHFLIGFGLSGGLLAIWLLYVDRLYQVDHSSFGEGSLFGYLMENPKIISQGVAVASLPPFLFASLNYLMVLGAARSSKSSNNPSIVGILTATAFAWLGATANTFKIIDFMRSHETKGSPTQTSNPEIVPHSTSASPHLLDSKPADVTPSE